MIAASISLHVSISDKTGMFMRPMCPGAGRSTGRTGEDNLGGGGGWGEPNVPGCPVNRLLMLNQRYVCVSVAHFRLKL